MTSQINQLQSKATDEETKQTNEHVFLERKLVLEACIVRNLKSRKQIKRASARLTSLTPQTTSC